MGLWHVHLCTPCTAFWSYVFQPELKLDEWTLSRYPCWDLAPQVEAQAKERALLCLQFWKSHCWVLLAAWSRKKGRLSGCRGWKWDWLVWYGQQQLMYTVQNFLYHFYYKLVQRGLRDNRTVPFPSEGSLSQKGVRCLAGRRVGLQEILN